MTKLHYNIKLDIPSDADSARFFVPAGYTARLEEGVLVVEPEESDDERIRKAIIELLKEVGRDDTGIRENAKCMIAYLERHRYSPMPEDTVIFQKGVEEGRRLEREDNKREWSEQDIQYYDAVMDMITNALYLPCRPRAEIVEWLKSLKNRGNSPKSNTNSPWKPSEEQMRALQVVVDEHWDVDGDALYSLYTDLKELM